MAAIYPCRPSTLATYWLYSSVMTDGPKLVQFFKRPHIIPKLLEEDSAFLDTSTKEQEITDVILSLKYNSAPGDDGFPAEFFKVYKDVLSPHFTKVRNNILQTGIILPSWHSATIIPILKEGKDATNPSYWPIALINQDNKIFTALTAQRLKTFICKYIHQDQTGFMPTRNISNNTRHTLHIIQHGRITKTKPLILSIDMVKDFNSISKNYFLKFLERMGCGPSFCRAITSLYTKNTAQIKVNAIRSNTCVIDRGP